MGIVGLSLTKCGESTEMSEDYKQNCVTYPEESGDSTQTVGAFRIAPELSCKLWEISGVLRKGAANLGKSPEDSGWLKYRWM